MTTITLKIKNIKHECQVIDAINETLRALAIDGDIDDRRDDSWKWVFPKGKGGKLTNRVSN